MVAGSARLPVVISIVIPTYNEGQQPELMLQRLSRLTGVDEILFVDASDDPVSLAVLETAGISGVANVIRAEGRGRAVQMNQGAKACSSDQLLFLHCDTRLPDTFAAEVRNALDRYRWGRFDLKLDAMGWRFRIIEKMINLRSRLTRIATGDQAIFTERAFFLEQGGFAEIPLMEDIEFSHRVGARFRPGLVKDPVFTSARRWIANGTLRTILLMWKLRLLYRMGVSPERLATLYRTAR